MKPKVSIEQMDVLEYLKTLSDDSVDLVIADPPYFIGFDGGKGWDSQWKSESDYLEWCREWSRECVRVLKPGGMFVVWGTLKTDTFLRFKLDVLNSLPELVAQNEIIWSYNWGGRSKANFARKHEYAWCYSKGPGFTFNADAVRVPRKVLKNYRTGEAYSEGTIPTSVWEFNNHTGSKDFVNWHPTTKNLQVLDRIIQAYTNPGAVVLDPFMGSGSTAVAAVRAGRSVWGCERDGDYYRLLMERLAREDLK